MSKALCWCGRPRAAHSRVRLIPGYVWQHRFAKAKPGRLVPLTQPRPPG